ncbi:hypothetical protein ACM01_02460 [Streptomyces viridochromogenes]|uniref:Uncharacterized protein n=1 Tax=Streptomyces viridochromogenes TaxID=1938 RepID=A0A0J8CFH5_STRVR|nr:hypothetical protein ACM01_02460 [Streptomyces viridochromogenes]
MDGRGVDVFWRSQMLVTDIRCRPRSGHREDQDTRITSYREEETTAVRSHTARLPSTRHGDAPLIVVRRVAAW